MNRIIGFILFFIGIGIVIELLLPSTIWSVVIAIGCLMFGYHLFCYC